jgi:hypothetical protein
VFFSPVCSLDSPVLWANMIMRGRPIELEQASVPNKFITKPGEVKRSNIFKQENRSLK